jgi:hypothetical protein
MKTLKSLLFGFILTFSILSSAQVSVNVNIGTPPVWGPVGYVEARYYYIPDIQTYYDINTAMFIYMGPRGWIHVRSLPPMYAHFDLYSGYKVVLNYRGDNPYRYYEVHKVKFPKGYKKYNQKPYKMKHDNGNHSGKVKHGGGSKNAIHIDKGGNHDKGSGGKHGNDGGGKHGGGNGKGHGKGK